MTRRIKIELSDRLLMLIDEYSAFNAEWRAEIAAWPRNADGDVDHALITVESSRKVARLSEKKRSVGDSIAWDLAYDVRLLRQEQADATERRRRIAVKRFAPAATETIERAVVDLTVPAVASRDVPENLRRAGAV